MLDFGKKQSGQLTTNAMDTILNSTHEDLKASLELLNIGELQSFINQMTLSWEQLCMYKDGLLDAPNLTAQELEETLKNIYRTAQKIEDVVTIAKEVHYNITGEPKQ
nr:MAG TPA: hypothetical protein [Caudoviricetes sp.]